MDVPILPRSTLSTDGLSDNVATTHIHYSDHCHHASIENIRCSPTAPPLSPPTTSRAYHTYHTGEHFHHAEVGTYIQHLHPSNEVVHRSYLLQYENSPRWMHDPASQPPVYSWENGTADDLAGVHQLYRLDNGRNTFSAQAPLPRWMQDRLEALRGGYTLMNDNHPVPTHVRPCASIPIRQGEEVISMQPPANTRLHCGPHLSKYEILNVESLVEVSHPVKLLEDDKKEAESKEECCSQFCSCLCQLLDKLIG